MTDWEKIYTSLLAQGGALFSIISDWVIREPLATVLILGYFAVLIFVLLIFNSLFESWGGETKKLEGELKKLGDKAEGLEGELDTERADNKALRIALEEAVTEIGELRDANAMEMKRLTDVFGTPEQRKKELEAVLSGILEEHTGLGEDGGPVKAGSIKDQLEQLNEFFDLMDLEVEVSKKGSQTALERVEAEVRALRKAIVHRVGKIDTPAGAEVSTAYSPSNKKAGVLKEGDECVGLTKAEFLAHQTGGDNWGAVLEKYVGKIGKMVDSHHDGDILIKFKDGSTGYYPGAAYWG